MVTYGKSNAWTLLDNQRQQQDGERPHVSVSSRSTDTANTAYKPKVYCLSFCMSDLGRISSPQSVRNLVFIYHHWLWHRVIVMCRDIATCMSLPHHDSLLSPAITCKLCVLWKLNTAYIRGCHRCLDLFCFQSIPFIFLTVFPCYIELCKWTIMYV